MSASAPVITLALSFVLGVGVPWLGMRMLLPALETGAFQDNYRGHRVYRGLGVVWLLWAGAAVVMGISAESMFAGGSVLLILPLAGLLALAAFAFGMFDDEYGSGVSKGFRGHLSALARGRLSTGGLKLIGISVACLLVAMFFARLSPWGAGQSGWRLVGLSLAAGAAMALTSNLVNLMDLRPGRALKTYVVLAAAGLASTAVGFPGSGDGGAATFSDVLALGLLLAGPVVAVWRLDLGEQGMLGDAGANPAGAVAGMLIVAGLPLWGLIAYLVLMLALNAASERISFSQVIARNRALNAVDHWGRADRLTQSGKSDHTNAAQSRIEDSER